jgi:hypothetical protein
VASRLPRRAAPAAAAIIVACLSLTVSALPASAARPASPGAAPTRPTWVLVTPARVPPAAFGAASFADPRTDQTVLFGGWNGHRELDTTWIWNGRTWSQARPATSPPARQGAVAAWDPATSTAIMFGGLGRAGDLNDTWSWTGDNWVQLNPRTSPPARTAASLAYDGSRRSLLLFGGFQANLGTLGDTWTWTGDDWAQQHSRTSPGPREGAALAAGPAGNPILFGGIGDAATFGDTWSWTGDSWTQLSPHDSPTARSFAIAGYSPGTGAVVVAGGQSSSGEALAGTWKWTGSTWELMATDGALPGRYDAAASLDPATDQLLVFGGLAGGSSPLDEQWRLADPTVAYWQRIETNSPPVPRVGAAAAFDPAAGQIVLFGGSGPNRETWIFQDGRWRRAEPATSPPPLLFASMAYDPATRQMILFGGGNLDGGGSVFDQTWEWTGSTWRRLTPALSPPGDAEVTLADDPALGGLILYGGFLASVTGKAKTWRWTGDTWADVPSLLNPGPLAFPGMAYDASSAQFVLFGGLIADHGATTATWELSREYGWLPRFTSAHPPDQPNLTPVTMAPDPVDHGVMVFADDGAWIWNGRDWHQAGPFADAPAGRWNAYLLSIGNGKMLLYGGTSGSTSFTDTWTYGRDGG